MANDDSDLSDLSDTYDDAEDIELDQDSTGGHGRAQGNDAGDPDEDEDEDEDELMSDGESACYSVPLMASHCVCHRIADGSVCAPPVPPSHCTVPAVDYGDDDSSVGESGYDAIDSLDMLKGSNGGAGGAKGKGKASAYSVDYTPLSSEELLDEMKKEIGHVAGALSLKVRSPSHRPRF